MSSGRDTLINTSTFRLAESRCLRAFNIGRSALGSDYVLRGRPCTLPSTVKKQDAFYQSCRRFCYVYWTRSCRERRGRRLNVCSTRGTLRSFRGRPIVKSWQLKVGVSVFRKKRSESLVIIETCKMWPCACVVLCFSFHLAPICGFWCLDVFTCQPVTSKR